MRYTDWLVPELKTLQEKREALKNIPQKIKILEMRYSALRSSRTDAEPVRGSSIDKYEDAMLCNIAERDTLATNYEIIKNEVAFLESALDTLSESERLIIDRMYIQQVRKGIDMLCDELGYERAQIYNIRNNAMIKLARTLYGKVEL